MPHPKIVQSKDAEILYAGLALTQAWLENYDELKHTRFHQHQLKQAMKRACDELEKHTNHLNRLMHQEDDVSEVMCTYTGCMEYLVKLMATCPPAELMAMVQQLQTYKNQIDEAAAVPEHQV